MIETDSFILNNESLHNWIEQNLLTVTQLNNKVLQIEGVGKFLLVESKILTLPDGSLSENVIFDNEFQIPLDDIENEHADNVDFLLFQFGNRWYYTNDLVPEEIKEFKYIGKPNLTFSDIKFPFLGVHAGFELCNGSRSYKDWIKKAKFLNIDTLGLAELNTLAGSLEFQEECLKSKMQPVIGETITILTEDKGRINIKLYVQNEQGWKNLLWINKIINVDNGGEFIKWQELINCSFVGLHIILTPEVDLDKFYNHHPFYPSENKKIYYQIDFVEWSSNQKDEQWLKSLKNYFDNYIDTIEPILICDAYYLDKDDHEIKKSLNNIGKVGFKSNSKDQYFKSVDDIYMQAASLFADTDERWQLILEYAIENANKVCSEIDFKIPVGFFRLPEYEMDLQEWELDQMCDEGFTTSELRNEDLFFTLINIGFENKILGKAKNEQIYFDRLQEEIEVIKKGGFISYFLILWDIIEYCKKENIWFGIGRGSAAGSLVSYLLEIVGIDPIKYGLKFSRFLNAGRIGKSLPDIDMDFQGERRDDVKRYIEQKYGVDYVTCIGTFGTLKIKSALKDLCREKGVDYSKTNYIASLIDDADITITELFKLASHKEDLKTFIQKHHSIIEKLPLCINQPKNSSIHASGVVIVPKQYGEIYEQMPVKKIDGVLVSEWEGEWIDKAGFLKCDILGIKQLDKIAAIAKLVKENTGDEIKFENIDLENEDVFDLFRDGLTEDVFQFGTTGLKAYCKEMKPDNINDLIAAVSLYRPGTMDTGLHKKYIKIKHGVEKPVYDDGTYEATKETYGIAVYQEQVMQICVDVAGFNDIEADDVRKAMGKKDKELLDKQKDKFIAGAVKKGFDKYKCIELWEKLETFSGYGFNKSHAAAYAITGYYCQWLKHMYPVEFWTVSLQYAEEKDMVNRIAEINRISNITIASVDINKSTKTFFADKAGKTIYWAINSVKWVGEKAVEQILAERQANGQFFSIEDFCDRIKGGAVNKRVITNLILAGAFDNIEKINPEQRFLLIKKFFTFTSQKVTDEQLEMEKWKDYQWIMKQKELTGFGYIDFKKIVSSSPLFAPKQKRHEDLELLNGSSDYDKYSDVVVAGVVTNMWINQYKKNKLKFAIITLADSTGGNTIKLWNDKYEPIKEVITKDIIGKILIANVKLYFDRDGEWNSLYSTPKTQIEII